MKPFVRKLLLTTHVTCSVGWIGAIASFLVLAVAGLSAADGRLIRAAYLAMELTGWSVIVPLSFASLISGVVQSLGTPWGLVRHYWVGMKLAITVLATMLLLLHMQPATRLGNIASSESLAWNPQLRSIQIQLIADAGLAITVLLLATTLAIYKPRGLTRYGARKQVESSHSALTDRVSATRTPRWVKVLTASMIVLVLVIRTLFGGHSGHHVGAM